MFSPTPGRSCTTGMPSADELGRVADAGELEDLRRVERAAAADDLAAHRALDAACRRAVVYSTPTARLPSNMIFGRERAGLHVEVRALHHRVQVRARRAQSPAASDVAVERARSPPGGSRSRRW